MARARFSTLLLGAFGALLALSQTTHASCPTSAPTITIDAFDGGALGQGRDGSPRTSFVGPCWASLDDNVGAPPIHDIQYRNYHKFDLSGVTQEIECASLELDFPAGSYDSIEEDELFVLKEVTSPPDSFGFNFGNGSVRPFSEDVYRDLGDGTTLGLYSYTEADEGHLTSIEINADGVAAINAARGRVFTLGGVIAAGGLGIVTSVDVPPRMIFENTGPVEQDPRFGLHGVRRLVLTLREVSPPPPPQGGLQTPGDCNQDGRLDVSDSVCLLGSLFRGRPSSLPCGDGRRTDRGNITLLDSNGDERLDLSDAIYNLRFLFGGGLPPVHGERCRRTVGCGSSCRQG